MAGELMATYMIGYGIASFAVGPLVDSGAMRLGSIYSGASVVAAAMIFMAHGRESADPGNPDGSLSPRDSNDDRPCKIDWAQAYRGEFSCLLIHCRTLKSSPLSKR
jgi:hypothetical protein